MPIYVLICPMVTFLSQTNQVNSSGVEYQAFHLPLPPPPGTRPSNWRCWVGGMAANASSRKQATWDPAGELCFLWKSVICCHEQPCHTHPQVITFHATHSIVNRTDGAIDLLIKIDDQHSYTKLGVLPFEVCIAPYWVYELSQII